MVWQRGRGGRDLLAIIVGVRRYHAVTAFWPKLLQVLLKEVLQHKGVMRMSWVGLIMLSI